MSKLTSPVCECGKTMRVQTNGVILLFIDPQGYQCKVAADKWHCSDCGNSVFQGFGNTIEQHHEGYESLKEAHVCTF